jgi:hypothetical protein
MFWYKHHAIPVSVVTATDCIVKATHGLTTAIEGDQEAAPDKLQVIQSLCHILLSKRIPQQPHPPPPTLLKDSYIDEELIHTWDLTIHTQPILPSDATQRVPTTGHAITEDDDALPHPIPTVHRGSRTIIDNDDNVPPMFRRPWTQPQLSNQAESHLINTVIQDNHISNFSLVIKPHKLHHGYSQAAQALAVQTYALNTDSRCFIGAIITNIQGTHLSISNSSRSPNIKTFGHVDLPLSLGGYSRVFTGTRAPTCFFIKKSDVTKGCTYTYGCIVCNYCPQKDKPNRTQLTVGEDCIDWPWNKSMPTGIVHAWVGH